MNECDVCAGTPGWYPIIDRHGTERYQIRCPECDGAGCEKPEFEDFTSNPNTQPEGGVNKIKGL